MAVDEAILEFVAKKNQPPTLRLYAWNPYCLSLGHAQPVRRCEPIPYYLKKAGTWFAARLVEEPSYMPMKSPIRSLPQWMNPG